MKNTLIQSNASHMSHSHPLKSKKACLIKIFKNQNHTINTNTEHYLNKPTESLKTERLLSQNFHQEKPRRLSQMRVKTQTKQKTKKPINIFQTKYAQCLKNGYISVNEQKSHLKSVFIKQDQTNKFQGPVFYSQRSPKFDQNPQKNIQTVQFQQEVYKSDKNPKLNKFKVSLKRNTYNVTEDLKITNLNKNHPSRMLITQLKTQTSEQNPSQSHQLTRFIPDKRSLSTHKSGEFDSHKQILQSNKKHSLHIEKLSQESNLHKSIKMFQKKRILLGKIESQKGIQQKYGDKILEYILRDRYKQLANKNDFIVNIKNGEQKTIRNLKNRFITDIEDGKYDRNFLFKAKLTPFKVKGNSNRTIFNIV